MFQSLTFVRAAGLALVMAMIALQPTPAEAENGRVYLKVTKASFIVGGSSGTGTLRFRGKRYPLSVGGVKVGLTIGVVSAELVGTARYMRRVRDIEGTYVAATGSATLGKGRSSVLLENDKGVQLRLRGRQQGLEASLDVGGIVIQLR